MTSMISQNIIGRVAVIVAVILMVSGSVVSCGFADKVLRVEAPGQVVADSLDGPQNAALLVQSTVTDFECALGAYILAGGLLGDEFADATPNAPNWPVDRRDVGVQDLVISTNTCDRGSSPRFAIYTALHSARFQGDEIAKKLEAWSDAEVPNRKSLLATAYAYAGYAVLLLGESYCSMAIDRGPELTRAQTFTEAEARFTKALAAAPAADADTKNMALVGRARARLNLAIVNGAVVNAAKLTEASTDAQQVPAGFVKVATFSANSPRRNNNVFNANNFLRAYTIEVPFRDVTHQGVADPRVRVTNTGLRGTDGLTIIWAQNKYAALGSPIPIARWAEAQLIIAEAQLESGNLAGATTTINGLHAAAGIPPFAGGTAAEIRQHLLSERANELFMEGQHFGDKIRYNLPFYNVPGAAYPPKAGGVYGPTRCLPLPLQEIQNNPNIIR
jgi:hypothetical protein